jgi:hypothetical protein
MIKTVLNISVVQITYNSQENLLYLEWKKEASSEEYQRAMIECLEFGRSHKVENFISDIRNQKQINPDNRKWFESQVLPSASKELQLKRAAIIHDGSWLQQKYLKNIMKSAEKYDVHIRTYTNEESAVRWIKKSKFSLKELLFG